ncbi:bardet-Biedl syndrome 5 protein [Trypanosoma rangeli]|uniref:Bardet-Biedl syndrome 5 protein n=1 Tax=Trypanosoma rangeli TaxID=5698 RepID=A0A3R7K3V6_TRYRA|nr:bardet-Biedl syndrome 5 protein [Trypanosoma rangeli]RNE99990.1 bardet-Biedl syndrome 5 protein [Trypanosoma rangeli]|eukprot:RNE99990.1 bardet-Biedl syndrome 5 protein [Trypanosoma rangeli]
MSSSNTEIQAVVAKAFTFWFDREFRFNIADDELAVQTARGETLLTVLRPVEDTRGNCGEEGVLTVTNLRCIWQSKLNPRKSLSIGYYGIQNVEVKEVITRPRATTEALYINTRFRVNRYEFVFTFMGQTPHQFFIVPVVWRAYDSSRSYRELRMRSSLVRGGDIVVLPGERLFTRLEGVTNVSEDRGVVGVFVTTNVRFVWFAQHSQNINISIPLLQLTLLRLRPTKYGAVLLLETSTHAGGCLLGFRVDPVERLRELFQECVSLWKAWNMRPVLGIAVTLQEPNPGAAEDGGLNNVGSGTGALDGGLAKPVLPQPRKLDGENVVHQVQNDAFAAYYADMGQKGADRRPEYDPSIGLAVERLRTGVTLRDLWTVTV